MNTALWLTGNILAAFIGFWITIDYTLSTGLFAWFVCAALADIRLEVSNKTN